MLLYDEKALTIYRPTGRTDAIRRRNESGSKPIRSHSGSKPGRGISARKGGGHSSQVPVFSSVQLIVACPKVAKRLYLCIEVSFNGMNGNAIVCRPMYNSRERWVIYFSFFFCPKMYLVSYLIICN